MYPRKFSYVAPNSVGEVLRLLRRYGDEAKLLAGGQSLIPMMKLRIVGPSVVIDLKNLKGRLAYIKDGGRAVRIGALTTHAEVELSETLRREVPLLPEVAKWVGDMQIRNMGTLGGSLAHSDPAADWPVAMLALDASVTVQGQRRRVVPVSRFHRGPFTTALKPTELLTEITVPKPPKGHGWSWKKFERKAGDFATVNVAAIVVPDGQGRVKSASIAVGSVSSVPYRAARAERMLRGKRPDAELLNGVAEAAAEPAQPTSDLRGSAEYKKWLTRVMVRRALEEALSRAGLSVEVAQHA
ncbi:MAG: xanthine dehydrogenase family protein subunit M [Nitrososphaerota archaeon]|nr:xanthine dehydrogenase family protein subunit M [Candidatus Calditenuaceae archaeon]MDW8073892.1 xanthine dehydrogenase family protein subunit M [Nitrososphaerota archaeon]